MEGPPPPPPLITPFHPPSRYPAKRKWTEQSPSPSPGSPSYFRFHSIKEELERDPGRYVQDKWRYKVDLLREFRNVFGGFPENSSFDSVSDILAAHHELNGQAYPTVPPPGHPELACKVFPLWKALPSNEAPPPQPSNTPGRRVTQRPPTTTSTTPNTKRPPKTKRTNTGSTRTTRTAPTELTTNPLPPAPLQPTNGDNPGEVVFLEEVIALGDHLPQGRPRDHTNNPPDLSTPPPGRSVLIPRRTWSKRSPVRDGRYHIFSTIPIPILVSEFES